MPNDTNLCSFPGGFASNKPRMPYEFPGDAANSAGPERDPTAEKGQGPDSASRAFAFSLVFVPPSSYSLFETELPARAARARTVRRLGVAAHGRRTRPELQLAPGERG